LLRKQLLILLCKDFVLSLIMGLSYSFSVSVVAFFTICVAGTSSRELTASDIGSWGIQLEQSLVCTLATSVAGACRQQH
jgi:hypothetical protein